MTKPWHQNYPRDVADEVDVGRYQSMLEIFHQSVDTYQHKTAFVNFGTELSFADIERLSRDFGAYLQHELGVQKGDRIALMCPNCLPFVVAMWGIIRVGAVQVNVNPLYTARELKHQLNDAQVDIIVIFSASTPVLAEIVASTSVKTVIVVGLDDLVATGLSSVAADQRLENKIAFVDVLWSGEKLPLQEPELKPTDLLFLQYTGGTTGLSKGAMLSHGNIIANIMQYEEFGKNIIRRGEDVVITAIPMYHIFALTINTLCYFYFGARNVLITNPRDMPDFVATWSTVSATVFTGVNTLFNGLLHTPGFDKIDFSSLAMSVGGGAPVQNAVSDRWQAVTGHRIWEGYGLSETSPVLTLNIGTEDEYVPGIGIPVSSTDISLRNDEGEVVAQGESGELCAKGPQVMAGYWNDAEATAQCMTADGYFRTGDIAVLDSKGFFHIVDRKKDMILVSGFNVYPNEIEAEVARMPGILESACVGVDDEKTGEAIKLFAVRTNPAIAAKDVTEFCRAKLAAYKVPKQVEFIDEIPKTSVGKILRRKLRV